jgi:hypothetical protein
MAAMVPLSSALGILGPAIVKSSDVHAQDYLEPDEDHGRFKLAWMWQLSPLRKNQEVE